MNYAYVNGIILNGLENMVPEKGKIILTKDEKIEKIISKSEDLSGYEIIDLQGQYIMPGLINLHVHLPASGKPKQKQSDPKKLVKLISSHRLFKKIGIKICQNYAKTELMSGVTTIRTVGGVLNFDTTIRHQVETRKIIGPRILASNMAVSVPGGHMAGSLAYEATSVQQAKDFVIKIAQDQPDLIKLMITGGVLDAKVKGEPGELKMPPEYVKAACIKAHQLGLKVAAHVESPEGLKVALENGVDTIEHGARPDYHMIELFKQRQACLVTTLSPALPYALFDSSISHASPMEQFNGQVVFKGMIDCVKSCLDHHIPVGLGTDTGCPYVTHYDMWRELLYFHRYCDVSRRFALFTATKQNAEIAGIGDVTGSIEVGKEADFIVTKDNPLDDLKALRYINMVVTRGMIIKQPRVKKMKQVEKELDHFCDNSSFDDNSISI